MYRSFALFVQNFYKETVSVRIKIVNMLYHSKFSTNIDVKKEIRTKKKS